MEVRAVFFLLRHPILALRLISIGIQVGAQDPARKTPYLASLKTGGALFERSEELEWELCRACSKPCFYHPARPWISAVAMWLLGWRVSGAWMACPNCRSSEPAYDLTVRKPAPTPAMRGEEGA